MVAMFYQTMKFACALFSILGLICTYALARDDGSDDVEQSTLEGAVGSVALSDWETRLALAKPIDIGKLYDEGKLVSSVSDLKPLVASKRPIPDGQAGGTETKNPKAYIAVAAKWTRDDPGAFVALNGKFQLRVCWMDMNPAHARGREITQQAIEATWQHHGAISFVYWKKCDDTPSAIRIAVSDVRASSEIGKFSTGKTPSMTLNFDFTDAAMAGCQNRKDLCIHSIAVHEFGHAIGFLHEQDSPEVPKWCRRILNPADINQPAEILRAKMATDWDEFSVMDYCFDIYSRRVQLSDCDIAALHSLYNQPVTVAYQPTCLIRLDFRN